MRVGKAIRAQGGFTMLAVLVALLLLALSTQSVMAVASQQALRERETLLLTIGETYRTAIASYYESSPGSVKQWPRVLDDLIEDRRFVGTRRHLRELYADPVARSAKWGLVLSGDGGITGVYSLAEGMPVKSAGMALPDGKDARQYSDWQFVYRPLGTPGGR